MISRDALFEAVWQGRASAAGWKLRVEYPEGRVRLFFEKEPAAGPGARRAN
jgi:hypothetical protein